MALDLSKLENVKKAAGKITARCPACAAAGCDAKSEHLVIYPDGKFGCVVNPDDKAHRKEIFALVGLVTDGPATGRISVNTFKVPDSVVVMDLGRFERFRPKPVSSNTPETPPEIQKEPTTPKAEANAVKASSSTRYHIKPPKNLPKVESMLPPQVVAAQRAGRAVGHPVDPITDPKIREFLGIA